MSRDPAVVEAVATPGGSPAGVRVAQRKAAIRMAVILATVAAVFFFGIILKQALLAH
jgi:hypothetical protein